VQLISATLDAEHETWSASFFGALKIPLLSLLHRRRYIRSSRSKGRSKWIFFIGFRFGNFNATNHPKVVPGKAKRPPGNRVASSLGRIVPTEAKPSELSGEILSLAKYRVKAKTGLL
jgi:hypothetical protein